MDARADYDAVVEDLVATSPSQPGVMFGMPCLKLENKAYAGLFIDSMVFKLTGSAHASALKLDGTSLFDPSGHGHPMKQWVQVPHRHHAQWPRLARTALECLREAGV